MRREAHVRFLGGRPPRGGPLPARPSNSASVDKRSVYARNFTYRAAKSYSLPCHRLSKLFLLANFQQIGNPPLAIPYPIPAAITF